MTELINEMQTADLSGSGLMVSDLRQEGTIAARVSNQHADWVTNKTNYRFDLPRRDLIS